MNNTKNVSAIVAVLIAATLVVGGTSAAMTTAHSAFAWKQDTYKKDTYMKGGENTYKKGRQANGNGYGNGNTETIQATTQNGKVSGSHNTLEQEAQNVICTHPTSSSTTDTPVGSCTSEGGQGEALAQR